MLRNAFRLLANLLVIIAIGFPVAGQKRRPVLGKDQIAATFAGKWTWSYYLKEKDLHDPDTVDSYRSLAGGMNIRKTPFMTLDLTLSQKGNRLSGESSSVMRFGNRIDSSRINAMVYGDQARFKLESSFGGRVAVQLTIRGDRLLWKIDEDSSEGEYWYPPNAVLRRIRKHLV